MENRENHTRYVFEDKSDDRTERREKRARIKVENDEGNTNSNSAVDDHVDESDDRTKRREKRARIKVEDDVDEGNTNSNSAVDDHVDESDDRTERREKRARIKVEDDVDEGNTNSNSAVKIKKEMDDYVAQDKKNDRLYGDRVLLHRQPKKVNGENRGMLKLGGGNCGMVMYPSKNNNDHPRFKDLGKTIAIAYNDSWQPDGPKYAGQKYAAVAALPDKLIGEDPEAPFSVFMKRTINKTRVTLGWEYCGEYQATDPYREVKANGSAVFVKNHDKTVMIGTTLASTSGKEWMKYTRDKLTRLLERDQSPASMAPSWMNEQRAPTRKELDEDAEKGQAPLAARARALGFQKDVSDTKLVDIMFNLDETYKCLPIEFVRYDEKVYDYVKDGPTNRNKLGKIMKRGEKCATASDWYGFHDQKV